jgi:ribosome-associated translation inhibitor RaiA
VIRIVVDQNETRTLFRVTIRMELPGPDISASEERHDLKETVHDAFAEIRRQVEKYRRKLNHTVEYKRPARRDRLRRLRAGVEPAKRRRQTSER